MKNGTLGGAFVTTPGLNATQRELRVLDAPGIVRDDTEIDYVRTALDSTFKAKALAAGYVLLGWSDSGPVHIFTKTPVRSRADFANVTMWASPDEPMTAGLFAALGAKTYRTTVPNVQSAFTSGFISATWAPPLSDLALFWYPNSKYMSLTPVAESTGALLLTKAQLDAVPIDYRAIVLQEAATLADRHVVERRRARRCSRL